LTAVDEQGSVRRKTGANEASYLRSAANSLATSMSWHMTWRRIPLLVSLLATLSGCRIAELTATDSRVYSIREDNIDRRVRVVEICTHLFPPVVPATAFCHVLMVENVPIRTDTWSLSSTVRQTPHWRTVDGTDGSLFKLAYSITANEPENRNRFIIGNHNPVIVAIGCENASVQKMGGASIDDSTLQMGMGLRLVGEKELESMVDKVIVLDHSHRRVIDLRSPMKLKELLDRKLWEGAMKR